MPLSLHWDGAGRSLPPEWYECADFNAESFRTLFTVGWSE
jgi:hypothetical protein